MKQRGFLDGDYRVFYLNEVKQQKYQPHFHGFHKYVIILSGHLRYTIEGKTYEVAGGDVLFVRKNQMHKLEVFEDVAYERLIVYMDPEYLRKSGSDGIDLTEVFRSDSKVCVHMGSGNDSFFGELLNEMKRIVRSGTYGDELLLTSVLHAAIIRITQYFHGVHDEGDSMNIVYDERILKALTFIRMNLGEQMSVERIADEVFLSRYYFMRLFREETGYSVHQYIVEKRLGKAHDLILGGKNYQEAARITGFGDYSLFLKAFKKRYGSSPRIYFRERGRF